MFDFLPVELSVTADDLRRSGLVADERQDFADSRNLKSSHGNEAPLSAAQQRSDHHVGSLGEMKVAEYYGLEWNPSVGVLTNVDCKIIEVRTRRIENGRDLPIRANDKWRLPHMLVWFDSKRMITTMAGWLCAWEGHQRAMQAKAEAGRDVWWQAKTGVWFIPPPYHSIKSLRDWINAGHPQHWAPEAYRRA